MKTVIAVAMVMALATVCWAEETKKSEEKEQTIEELEGPDVAQVKRSPGMISPWKILSMSEDEKRGTPWEILSMGKRGEELLEEEKRSTPWEILGMKGKRDYLDDEDFEEEEKRNTPWKILGMGEEKRGMAATRRLVTFPCNKKTAYCKNRGKGPRVTFPRRGGRPMCACMCLFGYEGPRCEQSWWNSQESKMG